MAKEEWKSNIQLPGIVTFISFFVGRLFVLGKRGMNPKVIKFLGQPGLLLLFEFISLFLQPYNATLTHHTPDYVPDSGRNRIAACTHTSQIATMGKGKTGEKTPEIIIGRFNAII